MFYREGAPSSETNLQDGLRRVGGGGGGILCIGIEVFGAEGRGVKGYTGGLRSQMGCRAVRGLELSICCTCTSTLEDPWGS